MQRKSRNAFSDLQAELLPKIDVAIERAIELTCQNAPQRLRAAIQYAWLAPGKRLRPMLALLAAKTLGADVMLAMPAAVAVEAIHCYSLIHDDLPAMDDDDLRRGRPTSHIKFDEATAILAGDALQPIAFAVLANSSLGSHKIAESVRLLGSAAGPQYLVGGQMEDMLAEQSGTADVETLARIHRGKTGAMIRVSVQLGAVAAGADDREFAAMSEFGDTIGLAFQIVDDLLDVQSDEQTMGKRTGKDAERGKLTYPGLYGVAASQAKASELLEKAIATLQPFEPRQSDLIGLAEFIINRSN